MNNRLLQVVLLMCALALVASCGTAHPRWIKGSSDAWVLPLVEANNGPELIVEAMIGDSGPYLFRVDPDNEYSSIDDDLARELDFYRLRRWSDGRAQDGHVVKANTYEVRGLRFGDMKIEAVSMRSFESGAFDVRGHRIHGVLGGGVLTSVVSVEIDRDAGVLRLSTPKAEHMPRGAVAIRGDTRGSSLFIPAYVNGREVELAVDVGRSTSIFPYVAEDMGLPIVEVSDTYTDQTGTTVFRTEGAHVATLRIGELELENLDVVRYWEEFWPGDVGFDGILGRDVLSKYHVLISYDSQTLYLAPRTSTTPSG